jgi:hypothetical protein
MPIRSHSEPTDSAQNRIPGRKIESVDIESEQIKFFSYLAVGDSSS